MDELFMSSEVPKPEKGLEAFLSSGAGAKRRLEEQEAGKAGRLWPKSRREVIRTVWELPVGTKEGRLGRHFLSQSLLSGSLCICLKSF